MRGNPNWVKGVSGNPSGKPRLNKEVQKLAREQTEAAVRTLADICGDMEAPPSARVAAATALLDRGWGKPSQTIDHNVNVLERLSDSAASSLLEALDILESGTGDDAAGTRAFN